MHEMAMMAAKARTTTRREKATRAKAKERAMAASRKAPGAGVHTTKEKARRARA